MINEDAIRWLENLKQDISQLRHEELWPYAQAIEEIISMLKKQEPREITKDEWESWKKAKHRDPLCMYWRGDVMPFWILKPEEVHEPAYLIGDIKIFNGKPDKEKMHEIWLNS